MDHLGTFVPSKSTSCAFPIRVPHSLRSLTYCAWATINFHIRKSEGASDNHAHPYYSRGRLLAEKIKQHGIAWRRCHTHLRFPSNCSQICAVVSTLAFQSRWIHVAWGPMSFVIPRGTRQGRGSNMDGIELTGKIRIMAGGFMCGTQLAAAFEDDVLVQS